jgi:tetratricopeptide (TPR) repeat protein
VTASGWHTIVVTVPKIKGATVNARRGYGIEPPRPVPPPVPSSPRTLAELTLAYDRSAFQSVAAGLQQVTDAAKLMKDFEAAGNPWPGKPHREAAFAIDISEPGIFSSRAAPRDQGEALLVRFARLIRHPLEPDPFERQWYYAVLTMLQGTLRPNSVDAFAARALDRFPDEPRFLLARAIAADQRTAAGGVLRWGSPTPAMVANLETARGLYEGLLGLPAVASEARIRLAFLLHRRGMNDIALARLEEAASSPIADLNLRYLHYLCLGHVLVELNRIDEGLAAYRNALTLLPTAQSARVAMMNALYRRGDRAEAETLSERIQTESAVYIDPWWMYWQGQYRFYPQAMGRLREMAW